MAENQDFKKVLNKYGKKLSFQGIPNIIKAKGKFLRIFWIISFTCGTGMLILNLYLNVTDYLDYSVNSLYTEGKEKPVFPDVTFCNLYQFDDQHVLPVGEFLLYTLMKQYFLFPHNNFRAMFNCGNMTVKRDSESDRENLHIGRHHCNILNQTFDDFNSPGVFYANLPMHPERGTILQNLPSLIPHCEFYSWNGMSLQNQLPCDKYIKEIWNPDLNKCFTISLNTTEERQLVYGLTTILYINNFPTFNSKQFLTNSIGHSKSTGVRVAIHNPNTTPNMKTGYSISPGKEATITTVPTIRKRLGKPYSDTGCTNNQYLPNSTEKYSYQACYEVCVQEQYIKKCKCLFGQLEYTKNQSLRVNHTICGNQSLLEIYNHLTDFQNKSAQNELFKYIWNRSDEEMLEFVNNMLLGQQNKEFIFKNNSINDIITRIFNVHETEKAVHDILCVGNVNIDYTMCELQCTLPCEEYIYYNEVSSAQWPHVFYHVAFYERFIKGRAVYRNKFDKYNEINENFTAYNATADFLRNIGLIEKNFLQINLMIGSRKPFMLTDSEKYTWDSILGLIGGTLGLWLGISIMAVGEMIELVLALIVVWRNRQRQKSSQKKINPVKNETQG